MAAFQRGQTCPQRLSSGAFLLFSRQMRHFARNCKFANLIQYDMQYIPCNNALLVQETLLLSQRSTLCEGASCLRKTSATLNDIHTKTDSRKIPTFTPRTRRQAPIITQIENQTKTGFRKILPITLERKNKYTHYYPSFLSDH